MRGRLYGLVLMAAIAVLAVAGCGGGGDSTSSGGATSAGGDTSGSEAARPVKAAPNAEQGTTFVSLGSVAGLGQILVDSGGMTLYDFHADRGTESACYGACAKAWPPLLTDGEPQPSNGTSASLLGTTERKDGTTQVTYAGHPLYGYAGDRKPGEANGNDIAQFGAEWYALTGRGEEPED